MGKISLVILIYVRWNLRCRPVFKRHETDQAFQKDAEQTATTTCTQKKGSQHTQGRVSTGAGKLLFGTLGAASPVRRIDPKTGEVVEIIAPRE
jgi:hypothetical protein